jgi:hypothetical protein
MEKPEGARRVPPWKFKGQMTGVVTAMVVRSFFILKTIY